MFGMGFMCHHVCIRLVYMPGVSASILNGKLIISDMATSCALVEFLFGYKKTC